MESIGDQPTQELAGGAKMPLLGLGVWQMAAGAETEQAVEWALEAGYRLIDTASMYRNEPRIGKRDNPVGRSEQDIYLLALVAFGQVTHIEYGHYVTRVKKAPIATEDSKGRPVLTRANDWPLKIQDSQQIDAPNAVFMVSHAQRQEKGSDVNVAAHLLLDILDGRVDAAIVMSNDSDLRLPLEAARQAGPSGHREPNAQLPRRRREGVTQRRRRRSLVAPANGSRLPKSPATRPRFRIQKACTLVENRPDRGNGC